ncbi:MAG: hypothetical protein J6B71_07265 [Clostridia bacterium]|nr:hypothetical protein [Clostridia bacterium]
MKNVIKWMSLLLVIAVMLPMMAACNKEKPVNNDPQDTTAETSDEIVGISKKNYNADFTILNPSSGLFEKYYWSEDMSENTNISVANYNREDAIEQHLGIEILHETYDIGEGVLYQKIEQSILAGDDTYQFVMTHSFQDLVSMMTSDFLVDLQDISAVSLNNEYWNTEIMESLQYRGGMYLGSSSFILHRPTFILFNKTMAEAYEGVSVDALYQHVRDKSWTIDQMFTYAQLVDISLNNTLANPMDGTYGFVSDMNWEMCSLATASGYIHVSTNSEGLYELKPFNETIFNIFKKVVAITDSNYFYGWNWDQTDKILDMDTGRAFFSTASVEVMIDQMLNSEVPLGVLPYPTVAEGMVTKNLDWAGYFIVPNVVRNLELSGEVLELLSYYGETEIKHEFYDVLLGLRASKEPQDTEMLELIFDNLAAEPALTFLNSGYSKMAQIFYVIPYMITQKQKAMASWYAKYYSAANLELDRLNN